MVLLLLHIERSHHIGINYKKSVVLIVDDDLINLVGKNIKQPTKGNGNAQENTVCSQNQFFSHGIALPFCWIWSVIRSHSTEAVETVLAQNLSFRSIS